MHCSGCGFIIGKDFPAERCQCPRCARVLRVLAFATEEGFDRTLYVPVEGARRRFAALYVSEAMLRFLLASRTPRPELWEPLLAELDEERLKAFAREVGWVIAGVYRDRGPRAAEAERPFARIAADLREGLANTILVTDLARVARRDLHALHELARAHGAEVVAMAPNPPDENLAFDEVDYDGVPDASADNPHLDRLWGAAQSRALATLLEAAGWNWPAFAASVLGRSLGTEAVRAWRERDPACRERSWRDVLTRYAIARARRTGDLHKLPLPRLQTCLLCRRRYLDAALPPRLLEVVAGRPATYCVTCLRRALLHPAGESGVPIGPAELDSRAAADAALDFFRELPRERFHAFLGRMVERLDAPPVRGAPEPPSSLWLETLRELGFLGELGAVSRSDSFYKAADGHLHGSLGPALLCNWLSSRHIRHRTDARYPVDEELNPAGTVRADFLVREGLVEFLGVRGGDEFRKTIGARLELARRAGLALIAVYASDLLLPEVLEAKTAALTAGVSGVEEEERAS